MQLKHEAEAEQILSRAPDLKNNPTFLVCLVLFKDIFEEIKNSDSLIDLFERILINYYEQQSPIQRQIFLQILIYLSNTRKGLILSELQELLTEEDHFDKEEAKRGIDEFVEIFDFAYTLSPSTFQLMSQNFQFVKSINCLIDYVNKKSGEAQGAADGEEASPQAINVEENLQVTYGQAAICRNICSLIEKQSFSLRQIDELVFQYQKSKQWQRLKEIISSIEVFSILYNPETKHQLAQYWQILEQFKYDPVVEYNRSLEGFVTRYSPNNEEIFVILI